MDEDEGACGFRNCYVWRLQPHVHALLSNGRLLSKKDMVCAPVGGEKCRTQSSSSILGWGVRNMFATHEAIAFWSPPLHLRGWVQIWSDFCSFFRNV